MRIALVTSIFGPYRVPLWNAIGRLCDLRLVLLAKTETNRDWNVEMERLEMPVVCLRTASLPLPYLGSQVHLSWRTVTRELERIKPDVILLGDWSQPGFWATRAWASRNRVPTVLWSESTLLSTRTRGVRVANFIKRRFVKQISSFYTSGRLATDYLAYFGVPRERIVTDVLIPDVAAFPKCEHLGPSAETTLLYVGRLVVLKGVINMLQALKRVIDLPWRLIIAGGGPAESAVVEAAQRGGFRNRVQFRGYVQQDALSKVYRSADILLFPTLNDVWGLVVNEALLSGLFVIGSDRAAASLELIKPGLNGEIVAPDNIAVLAASIRKALAGLPYDRRKIRATVEHQTPERAAMKITEAVELAIGLSQRSGD